MDIEHCVATVRAFLPDDGTSVLWHCDDCDVEVYRCIHQTNVPNGFLGERLTYLSGGAQINIMTYLPLWGPATLHTSRLRPNWTMDGLERRLRIQLAKVEALTGLYRMRDTVHQGLQVIALEPALRADFEETAIARQRTPEPMDMEPDDCAFWLRYLAAQGILDNALSI